MPLVIACKLPHGLSIKHGADTLDINGANADYDALNPPSNGAITESQSVIAGYGITKLNDKQADIYQDWKKSVTLDKNGNKLLEPFLPLTNGSLEDFPNESEARKALPHITDTVATGADGLDADAELKKGTAGQPLEVESSTGSKK